MAQAFTLPCAPSASASWRSCNSGFNMNIYGLDFTSSPSRRKPITCACCQLHDTTLSVKTLLKMPSFDEFEAFLRSDGPWLAALDFPFGQPRKLITNLGWPQNWQGYMSVIASMSKAEFEDTLHKYRASCASGDKLHMRVTDQLAGAISPMMLHRVPVGKMFYQGATRLFNSPISILPCRPTADNRIAVEGYPALVARKLIGKRSYKSDMRSQQTIDKQVARREIVQGLHSERLVIWYGLSVEMSGEIEEMLVQDAMGDMLDAVLCAVQA
ncbi:MAG TPA: hypothetical protein VFQ36_21730, partial [Ktedonobacteraceae bacterium]|nr:hypothetical protein [Ktedonobacteraceae bacterium]